MKRPQREFYAIGEVCELFGMKPHVLRYWETQFPALSPPKNRAGNRVYRQRDLELIALIQHLVRDERYTLEQSFLRSLRGELEEIMELLGPG
jgi:DNA-binding transcriptional MerR regulator